MILRFLMGVIFCPSGGEGTGAPSQTVGMNVEEPCGNQGGKINVLL